MVGVSANVDSGAAINRISIGNSVTNTTDNTVVIGNSSMTKISGQVAWTNPSDQRLKENIQTSNLGLDFISKLRPVTYNFITHPGSTQDGLIAQEVEAAAQSMGATFHGVNPPSSPTEFYSMSYSTFVMPLINAVKELKGENDALKQENSDLKTRLEKVEKTLGL